MMVKFVWKNAMTDRARVIIVAQDYVVGKDTTITAMAVTDQLEAMGVTFAYLMVICYDYIKLKIKAL